MIRDKGWIRILFLIAALLFMGMNHRGELMADHVFLRLGLWPWSEHEGNQGWHISALVGIVFLFLSGKLVIDHYRTRFTKYVGRTVVISCVVFFYLFPLATEQLYFLSHRHLTGVAAVDLLKKDSRCSYQTSQTETKVQMECSLRLANYGGQRLELLVRPIIHTRRGAVQGIWSFAEVRHQEVLLLPRSNEVYTIRFESEPDERIGNYSASGSTNEFSVEFAAGEQRKEAYTDLHLRK